MNTQRRKRKKERRGITSMWLRTTTKNFGHNSWRPSRVSKGHLPSQIKTRYCLIEYIHRFSPVVNEFLFILCLFDGVFSYQTIRRRNAAQSAYTESDRLQEEAVVPVDWPYLKDYHATDFEGLKNRIRNRTHDRWSLGRDSSPGPPTNAALGTVLSPRCAAFPMCTAANCRWSFLYGVILCVSVATFCVLFYYVCIAVLHTLVAGLLARSQYPQGPATGHLGIGFSWFPCV
jgi:hypothetical protein